MAIDRQLHDCGMYILGNFHTGWTIKDEQGKTNIFAFTSEKANAALNRIRVDLNTGFDLLKSGQATIIIATVAQNQEPVKNYLKNHGFLCSKEYKNKSKEKHWLLYITNSRRAEWENLKKMPDLKTPVTFFKPQRVKK
jgi:hypothetical protein